MVKKWTNPPRPSRREGVISKRILHYVFTLDYDTRASYLFWKITSIISNQINYYYIVIMIPIPDPNSGSQFRGIWDGMGWDGMGWDRIGSF